ncbi:MAG: pseudouridine synthase, partial [Candidatus Electryoneaceae bacterium]|nr:pseudouridine synthase [Candidatus Electryoneaceae bacterium]
MRLAKYLSTAGVASRRAAEKIVNEGRVTVNGKIVTDPACNIDDDDNVHLDDQPVTPHSSDEMIYIMLHKPVGVVSTMIIGDEQGPALTDLIQLPQRTHPVGRLDKDSSGLLLLTNDGEMTHRLTHPSHKIEKEYVVRLNRRLIAQDFKRLTGGVTVDDRRVKMHRLESAHGGRIRIVISEGRKRIIRRMFKKIGPRVIELKRVRIGPIHLGHLTTVHWRYLTSTE